MDVTSTERDQTIGGRSTPAVAVTGPLTKLGYQPALDGLRAVAIGLVLLEHTGLAIFDGGRNGVIVFFVLSGFLITKLMVEEWGRTDSLDIKSFYLRRTIRIMPAPLLMIGVLLLLQNEIVPDPIQQDYFRFELLLAALYITNLRPLWGEIPANISPNYMTHTWSLAVEEHFYLVWPWVLKKLRLPDRPVDRVIRGLLWFAVAVTVVRQLLVVVYPDGVAFSLFSFDGFALGAALAFALHHGLGRRLFDVVRKPAVFWGALVLLAVDLLGGEFLHSFAYIYYTYVGLAAVALIGHLVLERESLGHRLLALPPVVYLGKLSYSIYLWHVPIMTYFSTQRFPDRSIVELALMEWPLTLVVSAASYHLVELPLVSLRRRFSKV